MIFWGALNPSSIIVIIEQGSTTMMVEITSFVAEQNYPILYVCFDGGAQILSFVGFVLDIFLQYIFTYQLLTLHS